MSQLISKTNQSSKNRTLRNFIYNRTTKHDNNENTLNQIELINNH